MTPEPAAFERRVYRNAAAHHYMKIGLVLESGERNIGAVQFKQLIVSAVRDLYGEVGGAFNFDVLCYDESALTAVLRVYNSGLVKLWSALTLLGSYKNKLCAVRVMQVSPFLLALSGNSRELDLD
uniref:Uncharacterized protein n=1 Tax=Denticeps clupeoides TaxID=299321 RepID=A0AAY4BYC9_9TELE